MISAQNSEPVWVIGDVQGCYDSLLTLLNHPDIQQDSNATLCFAGDLINRGPQSLACLRHIRNLGSKAVSLLGNHDIHLLGVAAGVRKLSTSDTVQEILDAPDAEALLDWLRHRPLSVVMHDHLIVHAGVAPQWDTEQCLALAAEVEDLLRADDWKEQLAHVFGNTPTRWNPELTGVDRVRVIINALTRMRTCFSDGSMNLRYKGAPTHSEGEVAWYELAGRKNTLPVVFGHWSTLGLFISDNALCVDSGCVWGRQLSAIRLNDRRVIQVDCQEALPLTPTPSH